MARSRLTNTTQDLIADGGAVLWSFIKGEQLEFPVTLNFIEDASVKAENNYTYEAVVVESDNISGQTGAPNTVKSGGIQTTLFTRLPIFRGNWNANTGYTKEDVVFYPTTGKYYKLLGGLIRVNPTLPDVDPYWIITTLNTVYVQFPATLASTWVVQALVDSPVYGFFELRVTEPPDIIFTRTFKPLRGMVEVLFSPTDTVTDSSGHQTAP